MNRKELISAIAKETGHSKVMASEFVQGFIRVVSDALARGEEVSLVGFGKFKVIDRPPRKGHNPKTGEPVDIPAMRLPKFTPGKILKEEVNQ